MAINFGMGGLFTDEHGGMNSLGQVIQAAGMSLMSSPRNAPLAGFPTAFSNVQDSAKRDKREGQEREGLKYALKMAGIPDHEAERLASTPIIAKMAIEQKNRQAEEARFGNFAKSIGAPPSLTGDDDAAPGPQSAVPGGLIGQAKQAIAGIESGGRYDATGPVTKTGDRAFGKYQVMGANIPSWTMAALGKPMTPEEFVRNPEAQEKVFEHRFGQYLQQTGNPQDAASMWFSGRPMAQAGNRRDQLGTSVPQYVQKFTAGMGGQQQPVQVASLDPTIGLRDRQPATTGAVTPYDRPEGDPTQGLVRQPAQSQPAQPSGQQVAQARQVQTTPVRGTASDASPAPGMFSPTPSAQQPVDLGSMPPPPSDPARFEGKSRKVAAQANVNWGMRVMAGAIALGNDPRAKMAFEMGKTRLEMAAKHLEPTELQKNVDDLIRRGVVTPEQAGQMMQRAMPDNTPTSTREAEWYRTATPEQRAAYDATQKSKQQQINIGDKVQDRETQERAVSVTKFLGTLADDAPKVTQMAADLDFLGRVVSKTNTGPGAQIRAEIDGIGRMLGMSDGKLKTQADAINAVVNRIAPSLRTVGAGSQSNAELEGFLSSLPQVASLPQGNQLILSTLKRASAINQERTAVAAKWRAGKMTASEAAEKIMEIDSKSIFASEEERALIDNIMGSRPLSGSNEAEKRGWEIIKVNPAGAR